MNKEFNQEILFDLFTKKMMELKDKVGFYPRPGYPQMQIALFERWTFVLEKLCDELFMAQEFTPSNIQLAVKKAFSYITDYGWGFTASVAAKFSSDFVRTTLHYERTGMLPGPDHPH